MTAAMSNLLIGACVFVLGVLLVLCWHLLERVEYLEDQISKQWRRIDNDE